MHLTTNDVLKILAIISADGFTLWGTPSKKYQFIFCYSFLREKIGPTRNFFPGCSAFGAPRCRGDPSHGLALTSVNLALATITVNKD